VRLCPKNNHEKQKKVRGEALPSAGEVILLMIAKWPVKHTPDCKGKNAGAGRQKAVHVAGEVLSKGRDARTHIENQFDYLLHPLKLFSFLSSMSTAQLTASTRVNRHHPLLTFMFLIISFLIRYFGFSPVEKSPLARRSLAQGDHSAVNAD
jgi:hypothetical protein